MMLISLLWATLFAAPCWAQSPFAAGQKWQIVLTGVPDTTKSPLPPIDAPVWDIDLFDSDVSNIATLKASGKIVICYFSAGQLRFLHTLQDILCTSLLTFVQER